MKIFTRISPLVSTGQGADVSTPSNKPATFVFKRWFSVSFLFALIILSATTSFAQVMTFDFSPLVGGTGVWGASPLTPTFSDPNVVNVGLTRGSGVLTPGGSSVAAKAWGGSGFVTATTTEALAIAGGQFITMTITPNASYSVSLSGIAAYNVRRSGTGPATGIWQYKVGAGSFIDIGSAITWGAVTSSAGNPEPAISLSSITDLQNVAAGTTITLRIVLWNSTGTSGTWYLNDLGNTTTADLIINGSATAGLISQTISGFPTTNTKTFGIAPYTITGVTGGGSGNPVTFASDNPAIASVSGNIVTINSVGAGSVHITASQAGNGSYNAAPDVVQLLTVNKATQTITFGVLIDRNDVDPNFQLTATGGGSTSPIVYTSSLTSVAQIVNAGGTVDPNGNWVDIIGSGQTVITASQAGDGNYLAATPVQQTQTIINTSLLNQTITFNPLANSTYGDADYSISSSASASSGLPVSYASSDPSVATIVGPNNDMVHVVGPGTTTITASQAGNGSYNAAPSQQQSLTVNKKTLTVSGATVDTKVYDAGVVANISNATLNGIISPDIVNFATTGGTFADPNVNNGIPVTANLVLGGADAVKYLITQPTGLAGNITKAPQTITFAGPLQDKSPGDPNFNYTATTTSGLPISYTSGTPSVITIVSGSLAHVGAIGASTITASQAGNQNYFAATPVQQTQNVVPATPGSIFANTITDANPSAANPFTTGQTLNPNITVSGIGRGPGIVGTAAANRYNANTWNAAAFDPSKYFEFTLTPNPGFMINFSDFIYNSQVSNLIISGFAVRSSVDNYATNIGTPVSGTGSTQSTISLTGAAYQGITSAITFRVYAWGATATTTTFSINDFVFDGNVVVSPPSATFVATNISVCGGSNDGTITLTPSGTGPFTYSWTGVTGSGNPATTPFSAGNVSSLTGLNIGYYNVTITDANLNTATITGIHIGYAYSVYVTNSGSISSACGNTGTIILYGNAGVQPYSYSLNGTTYQPGNTFTGLAAGPYTAYVKDAAGCVSTKSVTVAAAAAIVVSPFVRGASSCSNDGSIEVYRTGGIPPYTYSKDGTNYQASYVFSGLAAGPYTLYVKDSKGCVGSQSATVTQGAALSVTANKTNASLCTADGTIQLNATGGVGPYTYSIDDGANYQPGNSFTGLSANTYPTKVKDSKGCTGSLNVTINLNPIVVTAFSAAASSCAASDGSIQLFRTGGVGPYTYSLDGNNYQNSNTFTGLTANYYEGFVKDSKGCVGELIDIYVGPDCGQRGVPLAKNADVKDNQSKVIANSALKLQVYPNPTATEFTLQLQGYNNDRITIIVTDIMGRRVYQAEGNASQQYRFGNKFNAGLYNVEVIRGNDKKTIRLVKE